MNRVMLAALVHDCPLVASYEWVRGDERLVPWPSDIAGYGRVPVVGKWLIRAELLARQPNGESLDAYLSVTEDGQVHVSDMGDTARYATDWTGDLPEILRDPDQSEGVSGNRTMSAVSAYGLTIDGGAVCGASLVVSATDLLRLLVRHVQARAALLAVLAPT